MPPVRHEDYCVGILDRLVFVALVGDSVKVGQVSAGVGKGLGVGDGDSDMLIRQESRDRSRGRLAGVAGVGLEGEAEKRNLLVGEGIEHLLEEARNYALLLIFVHLDDAHPVFGGSMKAEGLAKIDEVQDVLLEAAAAEAGPGLQELGADALVSADDPGDFVHVGASGFAEAGDGVDGRDALGEEGVCGEFRQLGRPDVGGQDLLFRDPGCVYVDDLLYRGESGLGLGSANQDPVGLEKILDGGSFGEEFGVAEDGEVVFCVVVEDRVHRSGSADRQSGLFDDDLVVVGEALYLAGGRLPILEVAGASRAASEHLGRGVHANKDDVASLNCPFYVRTEEEILASNLLDDIHETWLVDRQGVVF